MSEYIEVFVVVETICYVVTLSKLLQSPAHFLEPATHSALILRWLMFVSLSTITPSLCGMYYLL